MNNTYLPTFGDLVSAGRFLVNLPKVLRHPITSKEAHATLRDQLQSREANFLTHARDAIYQNHASPYRRLLKVAGCEYGDLERLVRKEGLEGALHFLYRQGIYLTVEESKGRRAVIRGSTTFEIAPAALSNPKLVSDLVGQTSSSRGNSTLVPIEFASVRRQTTDLFIDLQARGGLNWLHAIWLMPGGGALVRMLRYTFCGAAPDRWFSLADSKSSGVHRRYLWSSRVLRWASFMAGFPLPRPKYVGLQNPLPIARWMENVLMSGRTPHLHSYPSCIVRICQTAFDHGINLRGAQFTMGGEPTTAARLAVVEAVGARASIRYATTEASILGLGCIAPEAPDDVHFLHDRCAVIQPGNGSPRGIPAEALLVTSILPRSRSILLNVSLGDQATVIRRHCGCAMEALGWTTHLHTIRSFEKLTAGGVTFLDTDLIRVLEDVLPTQFGGGPTDYQLLDEESPDGKPRVRLLVHPRLGPMDPAQVRQTFLDAIGAGSGVERVMMLVWRDAGLPIVERQAPRVTSGGKILHVHLDLPNRLLVDDAD
jgi:hypothetical protein